MWELVQAAQHDIRKLRDQWHNLDKSLEQDMEEARLERDGCKEARDRAKEELESATKNYEKIHGFPPPAGTYARPLIYWLFIAILFICELPLNAIVFRLFGEPEVFTYVVTGAIAVFLLACAHFLGHILREEKWDRTKIVLTIVLVVIPIRVIAGVAWLREIYLSQVLGKSILKWSKGMLYTFFVFNLGIFTVAAIASYFVYDPLLFAVYRARERFDNAERKLIEVEKRLTEAEIEREQTRQSYMAKARQIKDYVQLLMEIYRGVNLRYRTDREESQRNTGLLVPKSFEKEHQPQIDIEQLWEEWIERER